MNTRLATLTALGAAAMLVITGAAPAAAKTVTKTKTAAVCADLGVAIPDGGAAGQAVVGGSVPVSVPKLRGKPQDGVVTAVNSVGVRLAHAYAGDLTLFLVSPSGKATFLADDRGSDRDGYGSGATSCAGSPLTFGDTFPLSIGEISDVGEDPITGSYRPEQPLSALVGGAARGNWTLVVNDSSSSDTGSINALSLNLAYSYRAVKKPKKKKKK
jgi:subtilisin-like proprotein convertase family protein